MSEVIAVGQQVTVDNAQGDMTPDVAVLADGRVVVAWAIDPITFNQALVRVLNPDGTPITGPVALGVESSSPHLAADDLGTGFTAEWTSHPQQEVSQVWLGFFDHAAQARGAPIDAVASNASRQVFGVDVAAHGDGVALSYFESSLQFGIQHFAANTVFATAAGSQVTVAGAQEFGASLSSSNAQALVWIAGTQADASPPPAGGPPNFIDAQAFNFDGSAATPLFQIARGSAAVIAALPGGRAAVAWDSGGHIQYEVVGVAGQSPASANTDASQVQAAPAITALSDGRFVIAWVSHDPGGRGSDYHVMGRLFNSDGSAAGPEFAIGAPGSGLQTGVSLAAEPGGGFVATWAGVKGVGLQHFQIAADSQVGTPGADVLVGTAGADVLAGGPGGDSLTGGGGADQFVLTADGSADRITDFNPAQGDSLKVVDASGAVVNGANGIVVYDLTSHLLTWDPDSDAGAQAPIALATLDGVTSLTKAAFAGAFQPSALRIAYADGSRVETVFDWAHAQTWDHVTATLDPSAKLVEYDTINHDGSVINTWFDNLSNQPWKAREADFDAQGRIVQYAYQLDDGTETIWKFDPGHVQPWDHTLQVYSPAGQLETAAMGSDDGSSWERTFDWTNTQPWSVLLDEFDTTGRLIRHTMFNDNGSVVVT